MASLANFVVSACGSPAVKRLNVVLDTWRATWELRQVRDVEHENSSFSADPVPFWWLAKLYLALHLYVRTLGEDSEFNIPRIKAGDEIGKIVAQVKIIGWLSRFRGQQKEAEVAVVAEESSILPKLMKPVR